jgi:hypothetical protein
VEDGFREFTFGGANLLAVLAVTYARSFFIFPPFWNAGNAFL